MKARLNQFGDVILRAIASKYFLYATLAWFVLQALYMAATTGPGIYPDEVYHTTFIDLYVQSGLSPILDSQEGYFVLSDVTRTVSYLYHYLVAFVLRLLPGGPGFDLMAIRSMSIGLSFGTLLLFVRIMRQFKIPAIAQNMAVFALTNTLMFVAISSAASYDNLTNFFALLLANVLVALVRAPRWRTAAFFILVASLGVITKRAFVPYAIMLTIAALALLRGKFITMLHRLPRTAKRFMRHSTVLQKVAAGSFGFAVLLSLVLVGERYVGNVITYSAVNPGCASVHAVEDCRQNSNFTRNEILATYEIDRDDVLDLDEFIPDWLERNRETMFGILGHKSILGWDYTYTFTQWFMIAMFLALIHKVSNRWPRELRALLLVALGYTLVLLLGKFNSYLQNGQFNLSIQGRYLFPILWIFYAAGIYGLYATLKNKAFAALLSVFIIVSLFMSSWPTFVLRTFDNWHKPSTQGVNEQFRDILEGVTGIESDASKNEIPPGL